MKPRLILASSSPQRRALLADLGYAFEIVPPSTGAEDEIGPGEKVGEYVSRLAQQKAADAAAQLGSMCSQQPGGAGHRTHEQADDLAEGSTGTLIIGCDTVAECNGQILGKPADAAGARAMLELLSGQLQHVYSGVCLMRFPSGQCETRVAITRLRMDAVSDSQMDEYIASGQWQGKAGAFGYQDRPGWLHIESGSESNVIGLPLELLAEMLSGFA